MVFKLPAEGRQCVIMRGAASELAPIYAGTRQVSILTPLLFLIDINGIVTVINFSMRLFAEYTSLSVIIENPETAAALLNIDCPVVCSLLIYRKILPISHPALLINYTCSVTGNSKQQIVRHHLLKLL